VELPTKEKGGDAFAVA
jgi:myosin heavy subunit